MTQPVGPREKELLEVVPGLFKSCSLHHRGAQERREGQVRRVGCLRDAVYKRGTRRCPRLSGGR